MSTEPQVQDNATDGQRQLSDLAPLASEGGGSSAAVGLSVIGGMVIGAIALWYFRDASETVEVQPVDKRTQKYARPDIAKEPPFPAIDVEEDDTITIQEDQVEHFFGTMELGGTREYTFVVVNNGEGDLLLANGPKSCGCTKYEIGKRRLKPGEKTNVLVEWKPKGAENIFRENMYLYTSDPKRSTISLSVAGTVASLASVIPKGEWDLGNIDGPKGGRFEGVIASGMLDKVELVNIQPSDPAIKVTTSEPSEDDMEALKTRRATSGLKMSVSLDKNIPAGPFRGSIQYQLKDRPEKTYRVELKAHRDGTVKFVGKAGIFWDKKRQLADLSQFKSGDGREGEIYLYVSGDQKIEVQEISSNLPFLKCTLEKDPAFKAPTKTRYSLKLTVPPGSPAGGYFGENSGRVVIKTTHEEYPEIKIRVRFVVADD